MTTLVQTVGVSHRFGGVEALHDVDTEFGTSRVYGIIGPNGAGKTTFLNILSGLQRPTAGRVVAAGDDITRWRPSRVVKKARIARTFQTARVFRSMTVRENIEVACRCMFDARDARAEVERLERQFHLQDVSHQKASTLSYGLQRRVELARTLGARPKVLLLDEPAAGLSEKEREELASILKDVKEQGVTIVLVEHHMDIVRAICEELYVLDFGEVISSGSIHQVLQDPAVLRAYLGFEDEG